MWIYGNELLCENIFRDKRGDSRKVAKEQFFKLKQEIGSFSLPSLKPSFSANRFGPPFFTKTFMV